MRIPERQLSFFLAVPRVLRKVPHWLRWAAAACIVLTAGGSLVALSQVAPANYDTVQLSAEPLYTGSGTQKPTLSLALSVEYPTVGAQYTSPTPGSSDDNTYSASTEYLGYFDADSCYLYNNNSDLNLRRFDRSGAANSHGCGGTAFSGNFMNWATGSAVDVLRLGLTGGDRIVDTASLTVLQRAVLDQSNGDFYNGSNFPSKRLVAANVGGALPRSLIGSWSGDVYVANCLNRMHFGTQRTGSCASPGNNSNLGVTVVNNYGAVSSGGAPSGYTYCATENNTCSFTGIKRVAYGAGSKFAYVSANNGIACSNDIFGDPNSGVAKLCYYANDNTGWAPSSSTTNGSTLLSSDSFFYVRVQVCERNTSGALLDPRTDYCIKYPNGNFKPAGNLQKYSDRLRVAAFGYLIDNTVARYGGVLRAPMKYVGPKTYNSNGELSTALNPKVEWDQNTGVFIVDPEGSTPEGKSGVINYLNQFGRTGSSIGNYKVNDPVGELYYESLRYIQGLAPTPDATTGMTTAMKDGFPVYSTWTDPYQGGSNSTDYSCVKNNIFVIGDVNTHYDRYIPGNPAGFGDAVRAANLANNEPNFYNWTRVVGGFEANSGSSITYLDNNGTSRNTTNGNSTTSLQAPRNFGNLGNLNISDNAGYYMAGMAYWAATHDIRGTGWTNSTTQQRPGMRATTFVLDVNEYGSDSVLNTRHGTQFFLTGKYGSTGDKSGFGNPYLSKTGTLDNTSWEDDTNAGEPRNYFLSSSASSVLKAIDNIFAAITAQGGSIGGGAVSTQQLSGASPSYIYQAQFDPSNWSGDVISYPLTVSSSNSVSVGTAANRQWSASDRLDRATPSARKIVIGNVTRTTGAASPFLWGSIETGTGSVTDQLNRASSTSSADGQGENRLNFLRGDRSLEGTSFRRRGGRIGDVVNSGVVYSGAPNGQITDSGYGTFYSANVARTPALFFGANDGMLHALNANTGDELFGYIPSWMGPRLSALTNTSYNTSLHQSYVDSTPAVAEAFVGSNWKTVLVGGTGGGGQGVFALDVTDPTAFDKTKVLWEFTDRDDPDMGNVIGRPQILKFRTSARTATTATYKYFAVVASGVNNTVADGYASTSGNPAIFLLDLSKSGTAAWVSGTNYYKISVPVTPSIAATIAPGIVEFSATGGAAGEVANLYFGDLTGNLWKLNFGELASSGWTMAGLSAFKSGNTPVPFFIARDSTANATVQPISMPPTLVYGPNNSTFVSFGTGKYLEASDNVVSSSSQRQTVYNLYDNQTSTLDTTSGSSSAINGRGRLAQASVSGGTITVPAFAYGRPLSDGDANQRSGWYVDLPASAERQISASALFGSNLVFGTLQPAGATANACGGANGFQYVVNVNTGNGAVTTPNIGILAQPFVLQVGNSAYGSSDSSGRRVSTTTGQIIVQGSSGISTTSDQLTTNSVTGRLSWRRINNYQQLYKAP